MPRSRPSTSRGLADESGSAALEFLTVGLIMLVPLVYLVVAVSTIQAAAFAVEGGARQAARVFVQAPDLTTARSDAERALELALADGGVSAPASIAITCSSAPCLTRQGLVTVTVSMSLPLPLVPSVIGGAAPLAVPMTASATEQVSRFWGSR